MIDVHQLPLGQALRYPMHDQNGVLLLAEGVVITPEFHRLLTQRDIRAVQLSAADAERLNLAARHAWTNESTAPSHPAANSDNALNPFAKIETGLGYVQNRGPALRQALQRGGCTLYDTEQLRELHRGQSQLGKTLSLMMSRSLLGRQQSAEVLIDATKRSMQLLLRDQDALLGTNLLTVTRRPLIQHCVRMSQLAMALGTDLGLNAENVARVGITGLLHDFGQLRLPITIRDAQWPLSPAEEREYRCHSAYSVDLLSKVDGLPPLVPMLSYQVHERLDGTGFPRQRTRNNIHFFARILHVADDYVRLTSPLGWRPALHPHAAIRTLLRQEQGRCADPDVLRSLVRVLGLFPVGCYVELSDGSVARVLRAAPLHCDLPIIQLTESADGTPIDGHATSAIIDLTQSTERIIALKPTPGQTLLTGLPRIETPAPAVTRRTDRQQSIRAPKLLSPHAQPQAKTA